MTNEQKKRHVRKEQEFAKMMAIINVLFFVTYFPVMILKMVNYFNNIIVFKFRLRNILPLPNSSLIRMHTYRSYLWLLGRQIR